MFPDLSMLAAMMQEPMKEYLERKGYTQIAVTGNVFNAPEAVDDNTSFYDTPEEMAAFILQVFVDMTKEGN